MQCFVHVKVNFEKKNLILRFEKFTFCVLARNTIMLPHLILRSIICQLVAYRSVKNKEKFQTFSYKSGCSRLREVVAYKWFQI